MADLTPEGLERIEGLAKAAGVAPWFWWKFSDEDYGLMAEDKKRSLILDAGFRGALRINENGIMARLTPDKPRAAFIAAANPETVLALVARVRELERGLEIIRDYGSHVEFINATLDGAKGGNQPSASSQPSSSGE